ALLQGLFLSTYIQAILAYTCNILYNKEVREDDQLTIQAMTTKTKKITRATIKSFIKRQKAVHNLYFKPLSHFDGMIDGIRYEKGEFRPVREPETTNDYNLGINGAWFVGRSRDYFTEYSDNSFIGYKV